MKEVNRYVCASDLWSWLLRRVFLVCGVMGWLVFFYSYLSYHTNPEKINGLYLKAIN